MSNRSVPYGSELLKRRSTGRNRDFLPTFSFLPSLLAAVEHRVRVQGLTVEERASYPLRVATSKKHRFARLREVPIAEVAKEPIIALSREGFRWYHVVVEKLLSPFNRSFKIVEEYDSAHSIFASVEAGRGVAIAHSVVALTTGERLVFRPLKPAPPPLPVVLAYRQEAASQLIRAFVAAAISVRIK